MDLLNQITNLEETEDIEKCEKCEEYRNWDTGGHCEFFNSDCDPSDCCGNFRFSKFWETKRGY